MGQNAKALADHMSSLSNKIRAVVKSHGYSSEATEDLVALVGEDRRETVLELVRHMVEHEATKGVDKYTEHNAYADIFSALIGAPAAAMADMQEILAGGGRSAP